MKKCMSWLFMILSFIHPIRFRGDKSSNIFPWISIWRLVQPHADYSVAIRKARWLRPAFAELYGLLRVNQAKELVAVRVWNAPDKWRNWQGAGVRQGAGVYFEKNQDLFWKTLPWNVFCKKLLKKKRDLKTK